MLILLIYWIKLFANEMNVDKKVLWIKLSLNCLNHLLSWQSPSKRNLCDKLKLLLPEKETGNNSNIINEEIFAITVKLLEYKYLSTKEHLKLFQFFAN